MVLYASAEHLGESSQIDRETPAESALQSPKDSQRSLLQLGALSVGEE